MEPTSTDSRTTPTRSQMIRGNVQAWTKCLGSAQTIEEALAAEPTNSKARLNLRATLENVLKEEWSFAAAAVASPQTDDETQAGIPPAAAAASIRNTHQVEDGLWKEVFYKPLAIAKRLKRPSTWTTSDTAIVKAFLEEGIDYYLSLLKFFSSLHSSTSGLSITRTSVVVRCLLCLADLSRYYCTDLLPRPSLLPATSRYMVPAQYYHQVLELSPGAALAHSNLGSVLRSIHNAPLQAALHFLAALQLCGFEGARFQLKQLLDHSCSMYQLHQERNHLHSQRQKSSILEGHFLNTVLVAVSCFAGRDDEVSHVEVNAICQDFLLQLSKLLQTSAGYSVTNGDPTQTVRLGEGDRNRAKGTGETVLLTAALLVAAHKVQTAQKGSTCAVLLASVLLTVVCQCFSALQHTITSLHSDEGLLGLTLATTPRLRPQPVAEYGAGSSSSEHNGPINRHSDGDKENEPKGTAEVGGHKKRPVPRRRRMRRRPRQATKGSWNTSSGSDEESSSDEHFSDACNWNDNDSSDASEEDLSASESDSGEDVIIESDDDVVQQDSIPGNKGDQKSVSSSTTSANIPAVASLRGDKGHLSVANLDRKTNSASPHPSISASEHLRLITISDGGENEKKQQQQSSPLTPPEQRSVVSPSIIPTMKTVGVDGTSHGVAALTGLTPPSSLLATVCVLTAWLRAESVVKGTLVWCNGKNNNNEDAEGAADGEENPDAGNVESSRVLWKSLAAYCNLIRVDLQQLSSAANLDQLLPNLKDLVLQCQQPDSPAEVQLQHDRFVLPENDFLKSTIPSVVPQHILQRPPGVQCPHVAPLLLHVGVTATNGFKLSPNMSTSVSPSRTICDEVNKLSLSDPCHKGAPSTVNGGPSLLNAQEESLLRSLRLRHDLRELSKFEECPLQYCEQTGLFLVQPRPDCVPSSASSSTGGSVSNSGNCKPYYFKKVAFGGYVMDKLVHRRTRSGEQQPGNTERGNKPSRRERGRRSAKNRRRPNEGGGGKGRRRQFDRNVEQEFSRETSYGRRGGDFKSEDVPRGRGRHATGGRQTRRRDDKSLYQNAEIIESSRRPPNKLANREVTKHTYLNSASSSGSVVSVGTSPINTLDAAATNECFDKLVDFRDATLISSETTSPTSGKFGAIGDGRKAATAVVSPNELFAAGCGALAPLAAACTNGATFGDGPVTTPRSDVPAVNGDDNEAALKLRRDHGQRMLTARWLRHKLDTTDCKPLMYLVPDATAIVYHLDTIKSIMQQGHTIVVVPMQVLSDIDDAKRHESAARDASRWLDRVLLGRGGRIPRSPFLRLQGTSERAPIPGVQCPPKSHKTAWRWFQILECCHHFSRLEYYPKESASADAVKTKSATGGRGAGSLYSDQHQSPVFKKKNKTRNSQPESRSVHQSFESSLIPIIQDDNLMDKAAVVTLLTAETGETISKLPFELSSLSSRVAAKLVFVPDYKKMHLACQGQT